MEGKKKKLAVKCRQMFDIKRVIKHCAHYLKETARTTRLIWSRAQTLALLSQLVVVLAFACNSPKFMLVVVYGRSVRSLGVFLPYGEML